MIASNQRNLQHQKESNELTKGNSLEWETIVEKQRQRYDWEGN